MNFSLNKFKRNSPKKRKMTKKQQSPCFTKMTYFTEITLFGSN